MDASKARTGSLVLALGIALFGAAPGDDRRGTGTVGGRVIDVEGRPVKGAEVWAEDRHEVTARARTDASGRFQLEPIGNEHAIIVWAEHRGEALAREHFDDVRVFAGRQTDVGDLVLVPGARPSGRVVDVRGRPVAGAKASILSRRHILGHTVALNGPEWTAEGDEEGRLSWPVLPLGTASITIRAPGKARREMDQVVEPGRVAADLREIRLDDELPVTGIVVDQDGRPVAGASVAADADYDHPATTDDNGRFAVRDAAIDAVWLTVEARGYFDPSPQQVHELKGQRTDLRLALQKAFTVEGTVVDAETGAPIDFDVVQLCTVRRDEDARVTLVG